ncbi:MAG: aldo/keto reductase, partial [Turicibacter sp.]|nr:aldo/keto reductase [Turicibacter sp.]
MKHIKLGKSDLVVSQIALGCMGLGGSWDANSLLTKEDEKLTLNIVEAALEQGINFFDHADIYGAGESEQIFGDYLKRNKGARDKMFIQTKCGIRKGEFDFSKQHILNAVDGSLKRLGV